LLLFPEEALSSSSSSISIAIGQASLLVKQSWGYR
jgi:hypothetical protein